MAIRRIPVPSTPRSSYDPSRPISGLLWAQIAMLEEAVLAHDPTSPSRQQHPKTEGQAARYIRSLHARLHEHLRRVAAERKDAVLSDKAAFASRSISTSAGEKRWPATQGPSANLRRLAAAGATAPAVRRRAAVARTSKAASRKPRRSR